MIMSSSLDDSQTGPGLPKNTMTTTTTTTSLRPPEQSLKCPRCDSPNTKFCYFNNYSLTQPRHFCKTCRRYWTKGGALRNVPVGGGCRKNKKSKSSASSSSSSPSSSCVYLDPFDPVTFNGLPPTPMDFQLGILPFPRLHSPASAGAFNTTQFVSFGEVGVNTEMGGSSAGLNFTTHGNLASSIESLSSMNQELHWKLQQQRLALFFGGARKESSVPALPGPLVDDEQQEPVSFDQHGTDGSRAELCGTQGPTTTAWFLESSCTVPYANENNDNTNDTSNWSGVPAWNDMHQFTALP